MTTQFDMLPPASQEEIKQARAQYADGSDNDVEIDDNARASRADDGSGTWVMAWVWVSAEELK